jgi:hypothetical protein
MMKRRAFRILVVSCAIALIAVFGGIREAQADTITVVNFGPPVGGVWSYLATQSGGTLDPAAGTTGSAPHGTFVTIYDFAGYVPGSEFAPDVDGDGFWTDDWTFSYPGLGLTPSPPNLGISVPDHPGVGNLVWTYIGTAGAVLPALPLSSLFGAASPGLIPAGSNFSSQDRSILFGIVPGIDESVASGPVLVPTVPDSGSTVAFLGLGLIVVATLSRKMRA